MIPKRTLGRNGLRTPKIICVMCHFLLPALLCDEKTMLFCNALSLRQFVLMKVAPLRSKFWAYTRHPILDYTRCICIITLRNYFFSFIFLAVKMLCRVCSQDGNPLIISFPKNLVSQFFQKSCDQQDLVFLWQLS